MAKTRRSDLCHCGSGKDFKRCCLDKDAVSASAGVSEIACRTVAAPGSGLPDVQWDDDGLDEASNGVVDLIHAGKLDEAEKAARDLLVRHPGVIDDHDRLGMAYEARGDKKQAAYHYRQAIGFIEKYPEGFEEASVARLRDLMDELDPPSSG
jgi:tetratricopeptide (TPR) repeat protein